MKEQGYRVVYRIRERPPAPLTRGEKAFWLILAGAIVVLWAWCLTSSEFRAALLGRLAP